MHRFQYDKNERLKIQNPVQILTSLGLKKGDVLVDIGSNNGFFAIPAAEIVGKTGQVYAVDIDNIAITDLQERLKDKGFFNVETFISSGEDFRKDDINADIIFLGTVLHDFQTPLKVLENAFFMLKSGGKLVNFDWKKKETLMGPPLDIRFSEKQAEEMLKKAHFTDIKTEDISENFYQVTGFKD
jgi:ubiquinone/menaquinone biosynthesis C-methylase UbiE